MSLGRGVASAEPRLGMGKIFATLVLLLNAEVVLRIVEEIISDLDRNRAGGELGTVR